MDARERRRGSNLPCYIRDAMPETKKETDICFMQAALEQARLSEAEGEVPVGAVVVRGTEIVGRGGNRNISRKDPTAHAEMVAMRQAAERLGHHPMEGCILYLTL